MHMTIDIRTCIYTPHFVSPGHSRHLCGRPCGTKLYNVERLKTNAQPHHKRCVVNVAYHCSVQVAAHGKWIKNFDGHRRFQHASLGCAVFCQSLRRSTSHLSGRFCCPSCWCSGTDGQKRPVPHTYTHTLTVPQTSWPELASWFSCFSSQCATRDNSIGTSWMSHGNNSCVY